MIKNILISLRMLFFMTIITGIIYPVLVTGISQLFFHKQANGSLVKMDNKIIGSELIGQKFISEKYFWARPSAIDYNTVPSGASNLGYTSLDLKNKINERISVLSKNSSVKNIPKDLLFASSSGIDPHISPESAYFQIDRIAKSRNFNEKQKKELIDLVKKSIEKRQFNILGEERVNVLLLNIELDKAFL